MELGQLRALRELGERGSIAAVAEALTVSSSSISQQISALQRRSPVPLTRRDGRRTVLTDAGHVLAAAAMEVEVALARAEQSVHRFQSASGGSVTVTAFNSAALAFFGALLIESALDPDGPQVSLTDFDVGQQDYPALTVEHDLVIAHRLVDSPPWPSHVLSERLLFEPLDLAMRRDHPLARRQAIEPADLRDVSWIAVHEGFSLQGAVGSIAGMGGAEPRISHRINEFFVAAEVIAATDCVALMPRYTSQTERHPDMLLLPLAGVPLGRSVDCLARPETLQRTNVSEVLARLRAISGRLAGAGAAAAVVT